jgi:DNA-binding NarL/FixJ family response regulator
VADSKPEELSALRRVLRDLRMEVVGAAVDWRTTFTQVPVSHADMLLVEWNLLPDTPALNELRKACPEALVVILISHLDARQQAARSAGADAFISKVEAPEHVAERLRALAQNISLTD